MFGLRRPIFYSDAAGGTAAHGVPSSPIAASDDGTFGRNRNANPRVRSESFLKDVRDPPPRVSLD